MTQINASLNDIFRITQVGDYSSSVASALYGINHRGTPGAVPINRDYHGLVLFTRPQLNLTDENLRAVRSMTPLLTTEPVSIQRMVRKLLDPRLEDLPCPLVDDKNAFIPILTNHALTLSGFPDPYVSMKLSKPGVYKEVFGHVDEMVDVFGAYDINVSFRNMVGDPITLMIYTWLKYMSAVFLGEMMPYPDFLAANEIDYNTRIWRLVLDKNKKHVTKIACTGASNPVNVPYAAAFDFAHDKPINSANDSLNFKFQSFAAYYSDPILVHEFNKTVAIFNPDMIPGDDGLPIGRVVKLDFAVLEQFNNMGYLRIDPGTKELEVWVSEFEYEAIMAKRVNTIRALSAAGSN